MYCITTLQCTIIEGLQQHVLYDTMNNTLSKTLGYTIFLLLASLMALAIASFIPLCTVVGTRLIITCITGIRPFFGVTAARAINREDCSTNHVSPAVLVG